MNDVKTVQHTLIDEIRQASNYNPNVQASPAYILWPDKDRQWEAVI